MKYKEEEESENFSDCESVRDDEVSSDSFAQRKLGYS